MERKLRWMRISKSKGMEDVGHIKERLKEMGKELSSIRDREEIMKSQLEK